MLLVHRLLLLSLFAVLLRQAEGEAQESAGTHFPPLNVHDHSLTGSEPQSLVDKYVVTYQRLLNETTTYNRLQSLANDSEKLLALSEGLGTMLVNGSLGYVKLDENNMTSIYFNGSGFSSQFGKLKAFFDDDVSDWKWLAYINLKKPFALRHGCLEGPSCFPETQDKFDVLRPTMKTLLGKLGVRRVFDRKNLGTFAGVLRTSRVLLHHKVSKHQKEPIHLAFP